MPFPGQLHSVQHDEKHSAAGKKSVLERLNVGTAVREFLRSAIMLLAEAMAILVMQVFRKDDDAVKYAVESLLAGAGPLAELSVRLKLVYALE